MSSRRLGARWVVGAFIVLAVVVLFVNMGLWQLRRLDQRQAYEASVREGLAAAPVPFRPGLPPYRRVEVTGTYDPTRQVALLGRAFQGQAGNHVLTPLVLSRGEAVIVDRGWVPYDPQGDVPPQAAPPEGQVRVEGVVLLTRDDDRVDGPAATVRDVDPDTFAGTPYRVDPDSYVQLSAQEPSQPRPLPRIVRYELQDPPPHLSYAVQWFSFAAIAVVGYAVLLRRRGRVDTPRGFGDDAPGPVGTRAKE